MTPRLLLVAVLLWVVSAAPAKAWADPELPPPRAVATPDDPPVILLYPPAPLRPSRYAVWQYYGVTSAGHFVPRIIDTPYGAYSPFGPVPSTWIGNHNRYYMPYAWD